MLGLNWIHVSKRAPVRWHVMCNWKRIRWVSAQWLYGRQEVSALLTLPICRWYLRRTKGFYLGDFFGGSGWTENRTSVFIYFYPVFSKIYIFMWNYSCFHNIIFLRFFTSNLLCLNAHLNRLSLDNHLVFEQPQWQCHVTMTQQWGHVIKDILSCWMGTN